MDDFAIQVDESEASITGRISRRRPGDSKPNLVKKLPPWAKIGLATIGLIIGVSLLLLLVAFG